MKVMGTEWKKTQMRGSFIRDNCEIIYENVCGYCACLLNSI